MKKLFSTILVLGLLIINPAYSKIGKVELTLTPEILEYFLKYLRNELATSFVVSKDGKFALYGLCRDKFQAIIDAEEAKDKKAIADAKDKLASAFRAKAKKVK